MNLNEPTPENNSSEIARRKLAAQLGLEVDDPLLPLMQANANLEEKVALWSTAILEMAALAKQQNQAMQETSQNSLKLMTALHSFAPESSQLQPLIKQLNSSWGQLQAVQDSLPQDVTQSLRQELEPILLEIQEAIALPTNLPASIGPKIPTGNTNWRRWFWIAVGVQWVMTMLFIGGILQGREQLLAYQRLLYDRSTWTIEKLERIEKALGIRPDRK